jgi:MATE family multidrug resistance protein
MLAKDYKIELLSFLKISAPAVLTQLAQMSMNVTDNIMAGHYQSRALAGISVGVSILNPIVMLVLGIFLALNPMVAKSNGENNHQDIAIYVQHGLIICIILTVPCIFLLWNVSPLLSWLNIQPEIIPVASQYLRALCWGILPLFLFTLLRFVNDGLFFTQIAMKCVFIAIPLNVLFNWIFMYGKWGFVEMGAVGTGYSTSLVWLIMALSIMVFTFKGNRYPFVSRLRVFGIVKWSVLKNIFKLGGPIALSFSFEVSLLAVIGLLVGTMSIEVVSGHHAVINMTMLLFMIPAGISIATTARVSFGLGRLSLRRIRRTMRVSFLLTLIACVLNLVLILAIPQTMAKVYSSDAGVIEVAITLLIFSALVQIPNGIKTNAAAVLRGLNDTKVPMYLTGISYWFVGIIAAYIFSLPLQMGASGLWVGLIVAHVCASILMSGRLRWHSKRIYGQMTIKI